MKVCVSARNVHKTYDGCVALRDVSLELCEGEILALLGPNGSGKTTLIKILATLLVKDGGTVEILGYDLDRHEADIRCLFGYVGQDTDRSAYARLTVRENLEFFGALRGMSRRDIAARITTLAHYFEFEPNLDSLFMTLSGGQKQTAVILRALLSDPVLVYLDEPTKGLDPFVARRVRGFLKRYVTEQRKSVLLTSHTLSEVDELADRVALINQGSISLAGTPAELKQSLGVQGFIELPPEFLTPELLAEMAGAGAFPLPGGGQAWVSLGVPGDVAALEGALLALKRHGVESQFRYRPATLEDAFLRHIGALEDRFDW